MPFDVYIGTRTINLNQTRQIQAPPPDHEVCFQDSRIFFAPPRIRIIKRHGQQRVCGQK